MTKIKYDKKLLHEICDRDKCIIDFEKIEKYNRDINIEFICNCGNNYINCLRNLHRTGAFCKECINKKAKEKSGYADPRMHSLSVAGKSDREGHGSEGPACGFCRSHRASP